MSKQRRNELTAETDQRLGDWQRQKGHSTVWQLRHDDFIFRVVMDLFPKQITLDDCMDILLKGLNMTKDSVTVFFESVLHSLIGRQNSALQCCWRSSKTKTMTQRLLVYMIQPVPCRSNYKLCHVLQLIIQNFIRWWTQHGNHRLVWFDPVERDSISNHARTVKSFFVLLLVLCNRHTEWICRRKVDLEGHRELRWVLCDWV